jgi:frataxin
MHRGAPLCASALALPSSVLPRRVWLAAPARLVRRSRSTFETNASWRAGGGPASSSALAPAAAVAAPRLPTTGARAHFSSPPVAGGAPAPAPPADAFPEAAFHRHADATLSALETALAPLEDAVEDGAFDLSNAMGVLTVKLGSKGTYVLNKQTPNRQVWWSSPVSGPRRYGWDAARKRWTNSRDGHDMLEALAAEVLKLTGMRLAIK